MLLFVQQSPSCSSSCNNFKLTMNPTPLLHPGLTTALVAAQAGRALVQPYQSIGQLEWLDSGAHCGPLSHNESSAVPGQGYFVGPHSMQSMAKFSAANTGTDEQPLEAARSPTVFNRKTYRCLRVCGTDGIHVRGQQTKLHCLIFQFITQEVLLGAFCCGVCN